MPIPFLDEKYVRYACTKCGHPSHCKGTCPTDPCGCKECECQDCLENKNINKGQN